MPASRGIYADLFPAQAPADSQHETPSVNRSELDRLAAIDSAIMDAARDIKVLSRLSWPAGVMSEFLQAWQRGRARLPHVTYQTGGLTDARIQLRNCLKALAGHDGPMADYLRATAASYDALIGLLDAVGTNRMAVHSRLIYGGPGDPISSGHVDNLEAARHFLDVGKAYYESARLQEADYCLSAENMRDELTARLEDVFPPRTIRIDIDPGLASKAAAGATRIRLRAATCYSEYDLEQLLQHEAFVHSLTALNGRAQPHLRTLSLGAPRTTGPQEGLATFSELVTGAIDISRVERLALRVVAIHHALAGADFVEVFRFLIDRGQTPQESFQSAMRVFRGAPLTGGSAFTKDVVYLHGLMEVHTFFRWAMQHQRLDLTRRFFAGRMTIGDVMRLTPLFDDGALSEPAYLPPWMVRTNGLAAYLAFSVFANRITVEELDEHHEFDTISDLGM